LFAEIDALKRARKRFGLPAKAGNLRIRGGMELVPEIKKQPKSETKPDRPIRYATNESVRASAKRIFAKYKATMRKLTE
jgi:hypothetical protein